VSRRYTKQRYLTSLEFLVKAGKVKTDEAATFRQMLAKCRTQKEFDEVSAAMSVVAKGPEGKTDAWSRLLHDDPKLDDFEDMLNG